MDIEDLVSAGLVGLMDAVTRFDPRRKVQFRSYAAFRIRGAILDYLRSLDWGPRSLRRKARAMDEVIHELTARLGRHPGQDEVACEMGLSLRDFHILRGSLKRLELGTLHCEDGTESEEPLALIPAVCDNDPLLCCLRSELSQRIEEAIEQLPEREGIVVRLLYFEDRSQGEIGRVLGVVNSRISRIHASAIEHLRGTLRMTTARHPKHGKGDGLDASIDKVNFHDDAAPVRRSGRFSAPDNGRTGSRKRFNVLQGATSPA